MSGSQSLFGNFDRKPLPPAFALMPLDEMMARIEAIRLEEADQTCPTCGSLAICVSKRCPGCQMVKPTSAFAVDRRYDRPQSYCRSCKAVQRDALRRRKIIRVLGRTA